MAERKCLMTFYPTDCKDDCFNCKCGGAEATKDMYVSINNVQRVCSITGGAADTDEGEYIAEVIRNNLENMVIPAADVQPVKRGHWEKLTIVPATDTGNRILARCSKCGDTVFYTVTGREITLKYCPNCGARLDGDAE